MSVKEAVDRGAKWLDKYHPGWKDKVDVTKFDIDNHNKCILSQVFSKHYVYIEKILSYKFCVEHGFISEEKYPVSSLQSEWIKKIRPYYNLSEVKVKPGLYVIDKVYINNPTASIKKGAKVIVLEKLVGIDISEHKNLCYIEGDFCLYSDINVDVYEFKQSS